MAGKFNCKPQMPIPASAHETEEIMRARESIRAWHEKRAEENRQKWVEEHCDSGLFIPRRMTGNMYLRGTNLNRKPY